MKNGKLSENCIIFKPKSSKLFRMTWKMLNENLEIFLSGVQAFVLGFDW